MPATVAGAEAALGNVGAGNDEVGSIPIPWQATLDASLHNCLHPTMHNRCSDTFHQACYSSEKHDSRYLAGSRSHSNACSFMQDGMLYLSHEQ